MANAQRNKKIALELIKVMGEFDRDRFATFWNEGATIQSMGRHPWSGVQPVSQILQNLAGLKTVFPEGLKFETDTVTAEGDFVFVEARGVNNKTTDGADYNNIYGFFFEFSGDKIQAMREYVDTTLVEEVLVSRWK